MIRLSVDTSFEHLGVCLTSNGICLANYYSLCNRKNSSIIFGVIDELLKNAEINLSDIDTYVVNRGPGSYTGLRVGISSAKGLCYALDIPLISINTLEIIAAGLRSYVKGNIISLIHAREDEFYYLVYDNKSKQFIIEFPFTS